MKKIFYAATFAAVVSVSLMSFTNVSDKNNSIESVAPEGGYIDVYFENKCSKDVTLKIQADGSASSGTLYAGKSERKSVKAGYKVYVNDRLVVEISDSHSGRTVVVCE